MVESIRLLLLSLSGVILLGLVVDAVRRKIKNSSRVRVSPRDSRVVTAPDPDVEAVSSVRVASIEPKTSAAVVNNLIIMSVMNPEGFAFDADKVKRAIYATGFVLNERGLYDFHEGVKKNGRHLFSLASATKPGVFDEANLESYACTGLTLFMDMSAVSNPLTAFEQLLKTSTFLRQLLSGELREGQRTSWTPNSAHYCRKAIQQYMASKEPEPVVEGELV